MTKFYTAQTKIQSKAGDGVNEIRAQCFKGIARARQGRLSESLMIYDYLLNKYYGIRSVYTHRPETEEQLDAQFNSILSTYVPWHHESNLKSGQLLQFTARAYMETTDHDRRTHDWFDSAL